MHCHLLFWLLGFGSSCVSAYAHNIYFFNLCFAGFDTVTIDSYNVWPPICFVLEIFSNVLTFHYFAHSCLMTTTLLDDEDSLLKDLT